MDKSVGEACRSPKRALKHEPFRIILSGQHDAGPDDRSGIEALGRPLPGIASPNPYEHSARKSDEEMKPIYSSKTIRLSAILLLFFVGLTFVRSSGYAGEKPEKDRVVYGGSSWIGHYPVWIGMKQNLFRKKGVEIHFRQFYASSARMGAMIAGNLDFASTGSISAIALMASGVRSFFVIGSQDSYATVEGIIAGKEIQTVGDLEGKKLAVAFASSAHVLVLDVLERNGLAPKKDVTLINLKVSEMPAAFYRERWMLALRGRPCSIN